jgi:putative flippase GtrA
MASLVELAAVRPLLASIVGFAVGATVKYTLNYNLTFRSDASHVHAVARFAALLAILFVANTGLFWFFNEVIGVHFTLAQVSTTAALILPGYLLSRRWVFRPR